MMLEISLIINIIIIICEIFVLFHIKRKIDILKYYTYLQNLIALIVSLIYSIFLIVFLVSNKNFEFIRGLRYVATCGLVSTLFIFVVFLGSGKKTGITKEDFNNFSPKLANCLLHYVVPILSIVSFVIFEREILLGNGIWTLIVAIPSCLYWIVYGYLSSTNKWVEPYQFSSGKNRIYDILIGIIIPIVFIIFSIILWNIK